MSRLTASLVAATAIVLGAVLLVYLVVHAEESWHHSYVSAAPAVVEHDAAERAFRR